MRFDEALKTSEAYQALNTLSNSGVKYCIWKSIDRFEAGVRGETDFDLLVAETDFSKAVDSLCGRGWLLVNAESWRSFPNVYDLIFWDPKILKFLHFHLHLALVMGESRVKSLSLSLEDLYLANVRQEDGVNFVAPELELIVFLIRVAVKTNTLYFRARSALLGRRFAMRRLEKEYQFIFKRVSSNILENLLGQEQLSFIPKAAVLEIFENKLTLSDIDFSIFRKSVAKFQRFSKLIRWIGQFSKFVAAKLQGVGKTLPMPGYSIALIGPDGSGKSAIARRLYKAYSEHLKIEIFYLGGSPDSRGLLRKLVRLMLFPPCALLWRFLKLFNLNGVAERLQKGFYEIEEFLILGEKLKRYQEALRFLESGGIVIFERFPVMPTYADGCPDWVSESVKGRLAAGYEVFKSPDLLVGFDVSEELARSRKSDHDGAVLAKKVQAFKNFYKHATNQNLAIVGDNVDVDLKFNEVCSLIWLNLTKHAQTQAKAADPS